jgi:carboxylate-amine ligase
MLSDYQLLAREQLICGTQVHIGIDDRDESVAVANRVTPHLPILLSLSASCPSVDTIVLIAGLFRALVEREVEALRAGRPAVEVAPPLGRAALWRAARSGLEGELVDISGPSSRPAAEVVTDLVQSLRPQLKAAGDWPMISELTRQALICGTSAARQRRALRRRGHLTDVVDQLLAETAGRWPDTAAVPTRPLLRRARRRCGGATRDHDE